MPRREKTAKANEFGTLTHFWVETGDTDMPGANPKDVQQLEKKIFMSRIERERWWPSDKGTHEVTFAFNPFTMELVMFRGKRDKADEWKKGKRWNPLRWVTGTIDWLAKEGSRWWIGDLKTGNWEVDAETSKQLRTYSIVPWMLDGCPMIWECDIEITMWPMYPLRDEPKRQWFKLSGWDIAEHVADLCLALSGTDQVNPVWYGPPQKDENGQYNFGEKLAHCAGCEAREPAPFSTWLSNSFWFRTLPFCWEATKKLIREHGVTLLPED